MVKWGVVVCITGFVQSAPYYLEHQQLKEMLRDKDTKLLWHQWFPTVGLIKNPKLNSSKYPYNKTLHELAPKKGKEVRVVFIDTGVAAFEGMGLPYHANLSSQATYQGCENNLIGHYYPCASLHTTRMAFIAGHGTHIMGIVAAKGDTLVGFAPEATCIMIKAFGDDGTTTLATFIKALERAVELKADILNLSLKIDASFIDTLSKINIERLLNKIPYVVAAAGNNNQGRLCYPACLNGIDFVVGAFDYNHLSGAVTVPDFCKESATASVNFAKNQTINKQAHRVNAPEDMLLEGDTLVSLPGVDVLSTGLAPGRMDGVYVVQDGTSVAAACMTGFLALLLGE
jgi:hypothetical protein